MIRYLPPLFLFFLPVLNFAQKKVIDHTVYDSWKSLQRSAISENGEVVSFEVNPSKGDGELHFVFKDREQIIFRGKKAQMSADGRTIAYRLQPHYDTIRQLKIDKVEKSKFPKDTLGVYLTKEDTTFYFPQLKSVTMADDSSSWMVVVFDDDDRFKPKEKEAKKKRGRCKKKKGKQKEEQEIQRLGDPTMLFNPITNTKIELHRNTDFELSRKGKYIAMIQEYTVNDSIDSVELQLYHTHQDKRETLLKTEGYIEELFFDRKEEQLGFFYSKDTGEVKNYSLYLWNAKTGLTQHLDTLKFEKGWTINPNHQPYFSWDGEKVFFKSWPKPNAPQKDTIPEDEKANLDVWNWKDDRLQPQQLIHQEADLQKGYQEVYHIAAQKRVRLSSPETELKVRLQQHGNAPIALGYSQKNYHQEISWDGWYLDYYTINLETGNTKLLASRQPYGGTLSPNGQFFAYFNSVDSAWHMIEVSSGEDRNVSEGIPYPLYNENHDTPADPDPYGYEGWTADNQLMVYDRFDAYLLESGKPPQKLTNGRASNWSHKFWQLDREANYLNLSNSYWTGFNRVSKANRVMQGRDASKELLTKEASLYLLRKAKGSDQVLLRTATFSDYPDLYLTDLSFQNQKRLSDANPQQKEYNWGTVEQVKWTSFEGRKLEGLLYKPEDFDPAKQYPLMVYFYETYTDRIHQYYSPRATASIVYPTEYVSNGYLVFIPDIHYKKGQPAKDAYDCIVSGTDYLTSKYSWIDSTRMALQGQSWGGYQTAMLITMTNKYKCAMAGAPVSNMTSAYGGIRWGSGLSRMFQYEKRQSRLGATLWEDPQRYIENSPIFYAPNVNTPLLMMHNDGDGAVPWYQGIEYFVALRRLQKPVWMLNYNGDQHNLRNPANKKDLSIRMRQFFDHYLLGAPEPKWMKTGIPAIKKGKENGYETE